MELVRIGTCLEDSDNSIILENGRCVKIDKFFSCTLFIKRDDSRMEVLIVRVGRQARVFHCQQREPLVEASEQVSDVFECWWKSCKTDPRQLTGDLLAPVINGFVDVTGVTERKLTTHPQNEVLLPRPPLLFTNIRKSSWQVCPSRIHTFEFF